MNLKELERQYEIETGKNAYHDHFNQWGTGFVKWLASRPTCGEEQRKFLDEVEKLQFIKRNAHKKDMDRNCVLFSADFENIELEKVIKGD